MAKQIFNIVRILAVSLSLAVMAAGCIQEEDRILSDEEGKDASSFVSLCFITSGTPVTRSNPTGGEYGDGQEMGQDYESEIKTAVAFFFKGEEGVNSAPTTPIRATVVFQEFMEDAADDNSGERIYTTVPRQIHLENGVYHALVVANPHSDWWSGRTLTLADVRDYIQTEAWSEKAVDTGVAYSDFVMTSASDASLILNSNPAKDPAIVSIDVERMAARLDYKAEASYTCTDPAYEGATVEITGAMLVNDLTAGSFLMKRVAPTVDGTPEYLGEEKEVNGVQTNYVLDPWTQAKNGSNNSFVINGMPNRPVSELFGTWFPGSSEDPNWWDSRVKSGVSVSDGFEMWQRIGYTLENTTKDSETGERYNTGVVFKARFHPKGVLNYKDGETFFALGTQLYASMENLMFRFYGDDFYRTFPEIEQCQNWGEVRAFVRNTLLEKDPSGYPSYLTKLAEDKADGDPVTDSSLLTWANYMWNECGYRKDTEGKVHIDENGKQTRQALNVYGVRTYEQGICYYTWWVRHSNDQNADHNGVMEYAIVRNNIYKLTVQAVYSLGGDIPGNESIMVDVYVNDWLLLDPEILPM